jgi:hypothetical protein
MRWAEAAPGSGDERERVVAVTVPCLKLRAVPPPDGSAVVFILRAPAL